MSQGGRPHGWPALREGLEQRIAALIVGRRWVGRAVEPHSDGSGKVVMSLFGRVRHERRRRWIGESSRGGGRATSMAAPMGLGRITVGIDGAAIGLGKGSRVKGKDTGIIRGKNHTWAGEREKERPLLLATKEPKATRDTVLGIVSPGEAMTTPGSRVGFGALYAVLMLFLAEAGGWAGVPAPKF